MKKGMNIIAKICNWYFSKSALPYWCIMLMDCAIVYVSSVYGYYVENNATELLNHLHQVMLGAVVCTLVYALLFYLFKTYRGIIRYSSFVDLQRVLTATILAAIACYGLTWLLALYCPETYIVMPTYVGIGVALVVATLLMWLMRVVVKTGYDLFRVGANTTNVFIYGVHAGGISLAKSIRSQLDIRYRLCGFVTYEASLKNTMLLGVNVYLDDEHLVKTMKSKEVTTLLVSPLQTAHFRERTALIDALVEAGVKIMMMPEAEEWDGKSELSHSQLREVDIEDLLPREKIEVDMNAIGDLLQGRRILITGAAGSIGSEMVRQVAKFAPAELVLIDQAETPMHDVRLYMSRNYPEIKCWTIVTSICKAERMEEIFAEHKPEYVFHAAAYKHVPMMEDNPKEAVQNNIYGTRVIADLAVKFGTKKFVMISTDKAVNPTNVMGCSKRICEIYCQALNNKLWEETKKTGQPTCQFVTTRFGNVLGSNGSVIPIFKEQIKKGGPITVTHPDIIRFFMLIPEACRLVLEAGTMGKGGEIFVFDMGKPVRIVDLAKRMIQLSGAKNIEIKFTGLRDGEKLYEEVLSDKETTKPTVHPKIMVAAVREYAYEDILALEKKLYDASFTSDDMTVVGIMKEIVPEFKSRNSVYEQLDK